MVGMVGMAGGKVMVTRGLLLLLGVAAPTATNQALERKGSRGN